MCSSQKECMTECQCLKHSLGLCWSQIEFLRPHNTTSWEALITPLQEIISFIHSALTFFEQVCEIAGLDCLLNKLFKQILMCMTNTFSHLPLTMFLHVMVLYSYTNCSSKMPTHWSAKLWFIQSPFSFPSLPSYLLPSFTCFATQTVCLLLRFWKPGLQMSISNNRIKFSSTLWNQF